VNPLLEMNPEELYKIPSNVTPFPFKKFKTNNRDDEDRSQKRKKTVDSQLTNFQDSRSGVSLKNVDRKGASCWFCLGEKVEKHLFITIGNYFYVALAKGGLSDEHVIISSILHNTPSTVLLEPPNKEELKMWKDSLRQYYDSKNMAPIFYEHYTQRENGHHLHIQVIPMLKSIPIDDVSDAFKRAGNRLNNRLKWRFLNNCENLFNIVGKDSYALVELPGFNNFNNNAMITRLEERIPSNFGRSACVDLLNVPNLDWKDCVKPQRIETKLTLNFRESFLPFDPCRKHLLNKKD
jgi:hypothetical protein